MTPAPSADFTAKDCHIKMTYCLGSFSLPLADLSLGLKPKLQVAV